MSYTLPYLEKSSWLLVTACPEVSISWVFEAFIDLGFGLFMEAAKYLEPPQSNGLLV